MQVVKFLSFLVLFTFAACSSGSDQRPTNELNPNYVVIVGGCEYYKIAAWYSYTYVHKGNCSNPIHKCNCK